MVCELFSYLTIFIMPLYVYTQMTKESERKERLKRIAIGAAVAAAVAALSAGTKHALHKPKPKPKSKVYSHVTYHPTNTNPEVKAKYDKYLYEAHIDRS
jgi:hypothetical protein